MSRSNPKWMDKFRERVAAWCEANGGVKVSETHVYTDWTFGGSYRLQTPIGPWIVHLPSDSASDALLSINTRFEN